MSLKSLAPHGNLYGIVMQKREFVRAAYNKGDRMKIHDWLDRTSRCVSNRGPRAWVDRMSPIRSNLD